MQICVLNASEAADSDVAIIAEAMALYLSRDVCPAWELVAPEVKFFPGIKTAPDGWVPAVALQSSDVASALGYHDRDPQGRPFMRGFFGGIPGGAALRGANGSGWSLCAVLLHEAAETIVDRFANLWADGPLMDVRDGTQWGQTALEACDAVQEHSYDEMLPGGAVVDFPDFLYPSWFDRDAVGVGLKYDRLGVLQRPFQLAPGGYAIVRQVSDVEQTFADTVAHPSGQPAWRVDARGHASSRARRRGW
jgi:hypothetical protein